MNMDVVGFQAHELCAENIQPIDLFIFNFSLNNRSVTFGIDVKKHNFFIAACVIHYSLDDLLVWIKLR